MIERGEDFRFALKTRETIRVRRDRGRQDLDRDLTFQPGVGRPKYLTHPAFADLSGDVVDADSAAGSEGQEAGSIAFRVARMRPLLPDAALTTCRGLYHSPQGD